MTKTNHHLIRGGELTATHKTNIVRQLLAARSDERTKRSFYAGVKYPGNTNANGEGRMYPEFFIPPYNGGKKLQTVIPMSPATHILSANAYELEIIRLIFLLAPHDAVAGDMAEKMRQRLKTVCFANHCCQGECFHTTLPVLRFLAATSPDETAWMRGLVAKFGTHIEGKIKNKKCNGGALLYYWLCLSELPFEIAESEISQYKEQIANQLNRNFSMVRESDAIYNPVKICAMRNTLARLPEYAYIKNRQPFMKDGRLHFDMGKQQ